MDIDNNLLSNNLLSPSNNEPFSLNTTMNSSLKTEFTKKNLMNYSNSNLSKKINDLSKTMGQSNLNSLNFYANQNFNKDLNTAMSNGLFTSNLQIPSSEINLTENNNPYPTEDSITLDSNTMALSTIDNSNTLSSSNVTSFTTTANPIPIPIPVNSSSFHTTESRNMNTYSYINSIETPTTLSIENIKKTLNSTDNVNSSLSMFYSSDMELNTNSLNSNNLSLINNNSANMALRNPTTTASLSDIYEQSKQQPQTSSQLASQQQQQSLLPPKPPTFMTTTIANPLLSHDQAEKISFSHLSSNIKKENVETLLNSNLNNNHRSQQPQENFSAPVGDINIPVKVKIEEETDTSLGHSLNANKSSLNMDMDMNLDLNYNSNINELSQLATLSAQTSSTDMNSSIDLNTMLSNQISNLHINSCIDLNQETSSSTTNHTTTTTTIPQTTPNEHSSSFQERNPFTTVTTTTSSAPASTNAGIYFSNINNINNNSLMHKSSNSMLLRKNLVKTLKKPTPQPFLNYSGKYPLSSSLKLVKKEPGTKINFVKKKVTMKSTISSSLDTKLSNIDDMNKKYNSSLLNTPHHSSSGINKDGNNMMSPSFVLTSPNHVSKPLNFELSNQIQQAPVSAVTPNNSFTNSSLYMRSNNLAIPTRKIRNYGYDTQHLSSSLTTKTIQNQHIVHNSLNDDLFTGHTSSSYPYKYNPPTAFHKGYFSLASQLDILNEKRKKRKESHNATERRRRDFINEKIYELSTLIPESFFEQCIAENKMHKGVILQKSVEYINHLVTSLKNQQDYTSKLEKEIHEHSSSQQ